MISRTLCGFKISREFLLIVALAEAASSISGACGQDFKSICLILSS